MITPIEFILVDAWRFIFTEYLEGRTVHEIVLKCRNIGWDFDDDEINAIIDELIEMYY